MKRTIIALFLFIPGMFLSIEDAQAYTLKQGAVSLSGSSNIMFQYSSKPRTYNYSLSVQPGYFAIDNLEIAVQLSGYYDNHHYSLYEIAPLVIYHIPLVETSNLFVGIGAGGSWSGSEFTGTDLKALLGWEYLLGSQVALQIKAHYNRFSPHDAPYRDRVTEITSQLGLSVYFQ